MILDLGDVTRLDANATEELRALLTRFSTQGRKLVISGMTGAQYEQLRRAGTGGMLDPMSVCPDLELAVARGLNLLEDLAHSSD
jgi:anti-anti-sigma regulatory factor